MKRTDHEQKSSYHAKHWVKNKCITICSTFTIGARHNWKGTSILQREKGSKKIIYSQVNDNSRLRRKQWSNYKKIKFEISFWKNVSYYLYCIKTTIYLLFDILAFCYVYFIFQFDSLLSISTFVTYSID